MVKRNTHFAKLQGGYLFPEVNKRKMALLEREPDAQLISLSIGDTTEPIPPSITEKLVGASQGMGTLEDYCGYGPDQGYLQLRKKISELFYGGKITPEEIWISDGAKCDIARLQLLFGSEIRIAVQDPAYPVYVDTSVIMGQTNSFDPAKKLYQGIVYMPCLPENQFFPDFHAFPRSDVIYFCSPNNPTGAVATRSQLQSLVDYAKKQSSFIVFDAAYSHFIQDPELPKSIFEIPGADECAIELNSFSKLAGFTGLRLSWTAVPSKLSYEDGSCVLNDWKRLMSTCFNGASAISQKGGMAVLEEEGLKEANQLVKFYMENTRLLKETLERLNYQVYGGAHAPYLWVKTHGQSSWEAFEDLLHRLHIVTTPGVGFGPSGEGFIRFSSFSHRDKILEAVKRLSKL